MLNERVKATLPVRNQTPKPDDGVYKPKICSCGCGGETPLPHPSTRKASGYAIGEYSNYINGHHNKIRPPLDSIVAAYEAGSSTVKIAEFVSDKVGRTVWPTSVNRWLVMAGVQLRTPSDSGSISRTIKKQGATDVLTTIRVVSDKRYWYVRKPGSLGRVIKVPMNSFWEWNRSVIRPSFNLPFRNEYYVKGELVVEEFGIEDGIIEYSNETTTKYAGKYYKLRGFTADQVKSIRKTGTIDGVPNRGEING